MSRRRKRIILPLTLLAVAAFVAFSFASTRTRNDAQKVEVKLSANSLAVKSSGALLADDPASESTEYVQRIRLQPQLMGALDALGSHLEQPGAERLTLTGTLTRNTSAPSGPVQLISEFPGRLRLEMQTGGQARVTGFDGKQIWMSGATPDLNEEDLAETLVYDSAEHFFIGQVQGVTTRFIGSQFRLDDGEDENYTGPFYDVYEVTEQIKIGQEQREQTKLYYFNSDTQLLELVRYDLERNGTQISVEVQISDWQQVQGQRVSMHIVRMENNAPVLTLTLSSPSMSPHVEDNTFINPNGNS